MNNRIIGKKIAVSVKFEVIAGFIEQHLLGALSRSGVHNQAVVPYAQTDSDSRFRISANENQVVKFPSMLISQ